MAKKFTQKEAEDIVRSLYNNEYELLSEYTRSTDPITLKHNCGHIYTIKRAKCFMKEHEGKCPVCYKTKSHSTKRLTLDSLLEKFNQPEFSDYSYISGFDEENSNSNTKILIKHNSCGSIFSVTPHMFFGKRKTGCPNCANLNRGKYAIKDNYLQSLLDEKSYGNEYVWLDAYKNNNKIKHRIKHLTCGRDYLVKPNDFQQGYRCPYCNIHSSKEEFELFEYIRSNYTGEVIHHYFISTENNKRIECDIYIPELNIAFEYNGSYWHSDKVKKDKNYHLHKKEIFKNKGIILYYIDEIDWKYKSAIWKKKILNILKINTSSKIYARNTIVKFNIDTESKRKFLNENHLQGYISDIFSLGLYYQDRLVALLTFSDKRRSVNNDKKRLELLRYATDLNYRVVGGFSKLLKHSLEYIKENYPNYKSIYTFADYSISNGDVYVKNGFKFIKQTKPSYFYQYKNKKYNRYTFRKSELSKKFPEVYNESLTEFQIADNIKDLYRIWNCGNLVFRYDIDETL